LVEYPIDNQTHNVCNGIFVDDGGSDGNYSHNYDETITFCSDSADYILFEFTHFEIDNDDTLFVYDGDSIDDPMVGAYIGDELPEIVYSKTGNCLTFRFVSDATTSEIGWRALISCTDTLPEQEFNSQNGIRYTCGGKFYDNGGASGYYPSSSSQTMIFHSEDGSRLQFNFQSFSTENIYDKLYIYDGASLSHPLIGIYSGTDSPGIVTSTTDALTFYFYADGSNNSTGWEADISCTGDYLDEFPLTSGAVTTCSGVFYDDAGPANSYSHNMDEVMTFCSDTASYIIFEFSHFEVSIDDTLFVYDGSTVNAPEIGAYTGENLPEKIYSKSDSCLTFRFVSDDSGTHFGWRAFISCSDTPPDQIYNHQPGYRYTCSGTYNDSGGPLSVYSANMNESMTFLSENGKRLEFDFQTFSTESIYDKLYIYDGPTNSHTIIGTYTGSTSPGIISSTSDALTFRFYSDGSNNHNYHHLKRKL